MSACRQKKRHLEVKEADEQEPLFLCWDAPPHTQTAQLLQCSAHALESELKQLLGFRNHQTCVKEAALLDLYVWTFLWASETQLDAAQTSFTVAVLQRLLDNMQDKQMSLVENMVEFVKHLADATNSSLLTGDEAKQLIAYVTDSLFQKYRLLGVVLLTQRRREALWTSVERNVEVFSCQDSVNPLEEGVSAHLLRANHDEQQTGSSGDDSVDNIVHMSSSVSSV